MRLNKTTTILLIALAAILLFIPFLGRVHLFDWDEINFAEASREMIKMDDYTRVYINFKPFWEKPPMFFWMQSSAMKLFGVTEFAARFPNAICGIFTLIASSFAAPGSMTGSSVSSGRWPMAAPSSRICILNRGSSTPGSTSSPSWPCIISFSIIGKGTASTTKE